MTGEPGRRRPDGLLEAAIGWDTVNWTRPFRWLERELSREWNRCACLEIGAGGTNGGLALWLASLGAQVLCTNVRPVGAETRRIHAAYGLTGNIAYDTLDVLQLAGDEAYDVIALKSVIGGVAISGGIPRARTMINCLHGALRPGGVLVFAENLAATGIHQRLRRRFSTATSSGWHYFTLEDLSALLSGFRRQEVRTYGFLGCLGPSEQARRWLGRVDVLTDGLWPRHWRYLAGGYAVK